MANIRVLVHVAFVLLFVALLNRFAHADYKSERMRVMAAVEPPQRPSNFADLDELNKYLEELRQYYTIIGRPRFGRSVRSILHSSASETRRHNNFS